MKSEKKKKKGNKYPRKSAKSDGSKKNEDDLKSDQFDFGGITDRDLKKNLGCG
jgi:hypothetical protein